MPAPTYIARDRHGGFLFRIAVPKLLRPLLSGRHSIRKSLQTHHRPTAINRARRLTVHAQEFFSLTKELYIKQLSEAESDLDSASSLFLEFAAFAGETFTAEQIQETLNKDGTINDDGPAALTLNLIAQAMDLFEAGQNKVKSMELAIEFAEQIENRAIRESVMAMVAKDYGLEPDAIQGAEGRVPAPALAKKAPCFSELWEEYKQDKARTGKGTGTWKNPRKLKEYDGQFRDFLEIIGGDMSASDFSRKTANTLLDGLLELPVNRTKIYPGIPIAEIPPAAEKISASTASQRLDVLKGFFKYLESEEYIKKDWLSGKNIDRDSRSYPTPTATDIQEWFNLPSELITHAWQFWIPRIALFSGARQNEIAQLKPSDIRQDDGGIWHFVIHDQDGNKTKSKAANRSVPIHSALIGAGFLEYWRTVSKKQDDTLWPNLAEKGGKKGGTVGAYWTRLKNTHNVLSKPLDDSGRGKVFHSLRRVILNELSNAGVDLAGC